MFDELSAIISDLQIDETMYSHRKSCTCTACHESLTADDLNIHTDCTLTKEHFITRENRFMFCKYCTHMFSTKHYLI